MDKCCFRIEVGDLLQQSFSPSFFIKRQFLSRSGNRSPNMRNENRPELEGIERTGFKKPGKWVKDTAGA